MTEDNGPQFKQKAFFAEEHTPTAARSSTLPSEATIGAEPVTRAKLRARQKIQQNRVVIVAAGAVVFALLVFAVVSAPQISTFRTATRQGIVSKGVVKNQSGLPERSSAEEKSLLPITDSGQPPPQYKTDDGYLSEQDLERSRSRRKPAPSLTSPFPASNIAGTLGSVAPFGEKPWQAPPYQPGMRAYPVSDNAVQTRPEHDSWDKPSLVFVHNASATGNTQRQGKTAAPVEYELGLPVGTRLRARLESAASTAVRTPVLAVIEYNYEQDGEMVVPAGAKAVGQIQEADRSGYMSIKFDSLLLPDGGTIPIQAVATDLAMRPVKGKVEGKNTGKNVLVRSLSGIGQASAMLLGRGSLNQPVSESDLIRERISNNVGEASDEEVSRLAVTARIVVTVPAGTDIYIVLEKSAASSGAPSHAASQAPTLTPEGVDQLRQLVQLQQELNQAGTK